MKNWQDVLDAEYEWYSTKHGELDGIPFDLVAHVIKLMRKRIDAALPAEPAPVEDDDTLEAAAAFFARKAAQFQKEAAWASELARVARIHDKGFKTLLYWQYTDHAQHAAFIARMYLWASLALSKR